MGADVGETVTRSVTTPPYTRVADEDVDEDRVDVPALAMRASCSTSIVTDTAVATATSVGATPRISGLCRQNRSWKAPGEPKYLSVYVTSASVSDWIEGAHSAVVRR